MFHFIVGGVYKNMGRTWRVSDSEVGEVNHTTECVIDLERNNVS